MANMEPQVPELDIHVDNEDYKPGLLKVLEVIRPDWKPKDVKIKMLQQGLINRMLTCYVDEENQSSWIVARVFGVDVNLGLERQQEVKVTKALAYCGLAPQLYAVFRNGLCCQFVEGKPLTWEDGSLLRDIKIGRTIARELAKCHSKRTVEVAREKFHVQKGKLMMDLVIGVIENEPKIIIDEETTEWFNSKMPSKEDKIKEVKAISDDIDSYGIPDAVCHGDTNPTNMIYIEEDDRIRFVDFEMSGLGCPLMDLSEFLGNGAGFALDPDAGDFRPEYKKEFVHEYLHQKKRLDGEDGTVTDTEIARWLAMLEKMRIAMNYLLPIMSVTFATASGNKIDPKMILGLGMARLDYYYKNKERMQSINVPDLE